MDARFLYLYLFYIHKHPDSHSLNDKSPLNSLMSYLNNSIRKYYFKTILYFQMY